MINQKNRFLIPIVVGVTITLGIWGLYHIYYPASSPNNVQRAVMSHRDARVLDSIDRLMLRAEKDRYLSDGDWQNLLHILKSQIGLDQRDAIMVMTMMGITSRSEERLQIARARIESNDPQIKSQALVLLRVVHAPEWKEVAQKLSKDSDPTVREYAQSSLAKGDYVPRGYVK